MIRARLTLVVVIVVALLPLQGVTRTAQDDEVVWEELAEEGDVTVSRGFELDEDASDPFRSDLVGLYALGIVHATEADAQSTFNVTPNYLIASFQATGEEEGYTFEDPETVAIDDIGERHEALSITATVEGSFVSLTMGVVTVQQGTWVQMLYGFGFNEEVVDHLAEVASDLEERWPNGDAIGTDDDMHVGGPWAMAPVADDVSPDLVWIEAFEEGPDSAADIGTERESADDAEDPDVQLPGDLKGQEDQPAETPGSDDAVAEATPVPEDTGSENDEDDTGAIVPAEATEDSAEDAPDADVPSRLVEREPGPLTLWIILPGERFTAQADDTCVGAGAYAGMQPGGMVSLLDEGAGAAHIESVMIESAGSVYFDSVLRQDVCAFRLDFTRVVPGTSVLVDLDRVVLGRFVHVGHDADTGHPPVYEIVVGK
jgi:hypothetical protein